MKAFPKIFTIGTDYISAIFADEVEVTEKVDGSMFVWGSLDGVVRCRSKGREIYPETTDKLFAPAVAFAHSAPLQEGMIYYGETLAKPKHNTLVYARVPKNHVMLFGASDATGTRFISKHAELAIIAEELGCDVAPLLYQGKVTSVLQLQELLDTDSYLGGSKIEGVVCKNYTQPFLLGGQPIPVMCGKLVSERFKEVHHKNWSSENTSKGKWGSFVEGFRTEARWDKAIQHLRDAGQLEGTPRDIGKIIAEIQRDIEEEEGEAIRDFLWREFGHDLKRQASKGAAEYYKTKLAEGAFA